MFKTQASSTLHFTRIDRAALLLLAFIALAGSAFAHTFSNQQNISGNPFVAEYQDRAYFDAVLCLPGGSLDGETGSVCPLCLTASGAKLPPSSQSALFEAFEQAGTLLASNPNSFYPQKTQPRRTGLTRAPPLQLTMI